MPTKDAFQPVEAGDPPRVAADLAAENEALTSLARRGAGLRLSSAKIASPFDARLRYGGYAAFRILTAHLRRHLWQADHAVADARL